MHLQEAKVQLERAREFDVVKEICEKIDMLAVVIMVTKACKGWYHGRSARSAQAASNVSGALIKAASYSDAKSRGRTGNYYN